MEKKARPLRFKLAWSTYPVGFVIGAQADNPVPAMLRDWLLANGYVEEVQTPAAPVEVSVMKPKLHRMPRVR